jgi:hypothetical protein
VSRVYNHVSTTRIPLVVTTSVINKKTYLMTFIAWAIIITDVIFGTFFDVLGKPLTSSFGLILFITMSITVFFASLYALRDYMVALRKDLEPPSFFTNATVVDDAIRFTKELIISNKKSKEPDFDDKEQLEEKRGERNWRINSDSQSSICLQFCF